jgi:hypothetical protein
VTALARPESVTKQIYAEFVKDGAIVNPVSFTEPSATIARALTGMDVVVSCMTLRSVKEEMALVDAASMACVGRYVPSFFGPCCPPRGVMSFREMVR